MTNLTVFDFSGKNIRFERRGDRVWVSLTDMAKASGKLVADYSRSKSTSEFLGELESIMGNPIMLSNVGGTPEMTGTWGVEEVAIDFAAWCSVTFRIWVSQQIRTLMTDGTVTIAPQSEQLRVDLTPNQLDLLRTSLSSVPVPLVDGLLLNEVQQHYPHLKSAVNAGHSLLAATTAIPDILLTPTAIGEQLGISARTVNAVLTANDYQIKNPSKSKTQPAYLPTEKGKPYSSNTIATGRDTDNTSYQHIKWVQAIVEVVRSLM